MNNRTNFLTFLAYIFFSTAIMIGCGEEDIATVRSAEEQRAIDSVAISRYITERGFDPAALDTTASGAIYMILEEGTGEKVQYNDILDVYLSIKQTNDNLLLSNIDTVFQNHDLYDSTEVYNPVVISHTPTGWALAESNFLGFQGFIGVREGMTALLNEMNVGGRGMIITPSIASLHTGGSITNYPTREVLVMHVYPTRVH